LVIKKKTNSDYAKITEGFFTTFSFPSVISLTNFANELNHTEISEELIQ